ncbi:MAG: iron-containing redox enzyme family protein [Candidatus Peribacteraceae bacterium]|nr:iron-containing redox enzyme family protein [Candidatus Peribacteraceae bacterium]
MKDPEFGMTLRTQIDILIPSLSSQVKQVFNHETTKERYINYLKNLYQIVVASRPLMQAALSELEMESKNNTLIDYLTRHLEEEKNHDQWILDDLNSLGIDREWLNDATPARSVANLAGSVYYRIFHNDPISIMGYIAVLETHPVSNETIDLIKVATGINESSLRTLRQHAEIDVYHSQDFYALLNRLSLTSRQKTSILECSKTTLINISKVMATLQ